MIVTKAQDGNKTVCLDAMREQEWTPLALFLYRWANMNKVSRRMYPFLVLSLSVRPYMRALLRLPFVANAIMRYSPHLL